MSHLVRAALPGRSVSRAAARTRVGAALVGAAAYGCQSAFRALLGSSLLALVLLVGCRRKPAPPPDAGIPTRIVSLSPSTTETLFVIGAGSQLVGRSRYCDWPPTVTALPSIGGYIDPNFEAILGLQPDLVTGARGPSGPSLSERLEARGIKTYLPKTESFSEIDAMILGLGERTGHVREAKAKVAELALQIAAIERAVASQPRPRVLLIFGLSPVSAAGPGSFADEMIQRAGGTNAVTDGGSYPTLGMEHILTLDPDVVVNAFMGESEGRQQLTKSTPGWARLRAVASDRVVPIGDESVLRPGPRIGDGVSTLARAIHPEVSWP